VFETQELARHYVALADEELLRLALKSEQLAPEAQVQLKVEMARRGIDSPGRLDELRLEEDRIAFDPKQYSKRGSGFGAALRNWARYHRQTGEWPVLSVVAYVIQGFVFLSCALLLVKVAVIHGWSGTRFVLVLAAVLVPEVCVWDRVQKRIRLKELRRYRSTRKSEADS
jgi:hypothetical protein